MLFLDSLNQMDNISNYWNNYISNILKIQYTLLNYNLLLK
jgi:hypothetical protein